MVHLNLSYNWVLLGKNPNCEITKLVRWDIIVAVAMVSYAAGTTNEGS